MRYLLSFQSFISGDESQRVDKQLLVRRAAPLGRLHVQEQHLEARKHSLRDTLLFLSVIVVKERVHWKRKAGYDFFSQ